MTTCAAVDGSLVFVPKQRDGGSVSKRGFSPESVQFKVDGRRFLRASSCSLFRASSHQGIESMVFKLLEALSYVFYMCCLN